MKDYKLKLGAVIGFDSRKEKDMIDYINRLAEQRRLGDFISNTIRLVLENPEDARRLGFDMSRFDITKNRENFYLGVNKQIREMGDKIDKIYDMTLKLFMMAQFGKVMGMEQQSENLAGSQLVLQHQVRELCQTLGVNADRLYKSNQYVKMEDTSEDIMAYIMSHYSNEVNSIMNAFSMMQLQMMQFMSTMNTGANGVPMTNNQSLGGAGFGYGNNMSVNSEAAELKQVAKLKNEAESKKERIDSEMYREELSKHEELKVATKFDDAEVGVTFDENADLDLLAQFLG